MTFPPRGLYVITDGPRVDLLAAVEATLHGGASLVQYRDKTSNHSRRVREARDLVALCARFGAALIVNDDVELACEATAAGVHLGEDDIDVAAARRVLGASAIIGVSCYDSLPRATELAAAGADYLAFGAFYSTHSKITSRSATPALLRDAAYLGKPRVAIGGITPDNAPPLLEAGADFLAVISGVFGASDPQAAARRYADLFTSSDRVLHAH